MSKGSNLLIDLLLCYNVVVQGPPVRIERHHFEKLLDTPLGTQVFTVSRPLVCMPPRCDTNPFHVYASSLSSICTQGLELLQMRSDKETGYYVQEHHVPFAA